MQDFSKPRRVPVVVSRPGFGTAFFYALCPPPAAHRGRYMALVNIRCILRVIQTRAEDAAVGAICSPLLDFPINEAAGVIFNIVGGLDMSLTEASRSTCWPLGRM